ncbi:GDSL esterase/lipase At4g26790 [Dioscorea cayenensis subsp. rotundata]|uniref:GDSL esterase/lipase At4g26790 n=1 Tax=Dioscorea cayennensis subsp. rotundata TaxID=55577 RepID=A0AB40CWH2_DIOCR|nr:GDSL esterase/lipase At4g26790 [Dioscorea cayenensis subsp. rotundata]
MRPPHLYFILIQFLPLFSHHVIATVPAIIVFGDSTVDAGNNNVIATLLKSNFGPYGRDFIGGEPTGRFCNGRLATDYIAEAFGLGSTIPAYLDPAFDIKDFMTSVCFASAGTGFDIATSEVLNVIPLEKEVEYFGEYQEKLRNYVGESKAKQIVNEAIYIVSIGTNDFLENYYALITGRFKQYTIEEFEDFLVELAAKFFSEIYYLGARKIAFTGLSPIGCLPLERTTNLLHGGACIEEYNKVAKDFNSKMMAKIYELNAELPGIRLIFLDIYNTVLHIIQNPSSYGFENSRRGCCATGLFEMSYLCNQWSHATCPDADKYVFWDSFHPTQKMNRIMAQYAVDTYMRFFI